MKERIKKHPAKPNINVDQAILKQTTIECGGNSAMKHKRHQHPRLKTEKQATAAVTTSCFVRLLYDEQFFNALAHADIHY